jgi:UDP-N-acetylglucosamine--N-acetylmuramyl-(pentapeptide) pyrophosphoryl-undecaprenol N-acetylglucosamine transferase
MKVIISGGGTGGHIYPAIAIANALKSKISDIEILFIGAKGKMEMEKVPAAGYSIKGLWISGLQRKITIKNLMFPFKVLFSLINAKKIINKFKPDVVVGVGGYASGPTLRAATTLGIPTLIQEQNSYPGITNRILAKKVNKICVAYNGMEKFFEAGKIVITGNPVRQNIVSNSIIKEDGLNYFGLKNNKKTILVIGGSLGARTINQSICNIVDFLIESDIQLIWQTGKFYFDNAKSEVENKNNENIKVFEFINQMDYAYTAADIIVSRAGAIAISELCIVGKPVILIPSPNVAEDHQTKNAIALVDNNAAVLIKDIDAGNFLKENLMQILNDEKKQFVLSENIRKMAYMNAAELIADIIISLKK